MNKLLTLLLFSIVNVSGMGLLRSQTITKSPKPISDSKISALESVLKENSEFDMRKIQDREMFLKLANSLCNDRVPSLFQEFLNKCPNFMINPIYVNFGLLEALEFRRKDIVLSLLSKGAKFNLEDYVKGERYIYNLLSRYSMADITEIANSSDIKLSQDVLFRLAKSWAGNIYNYVNFGESADSIRELPQFYTGYNILIALKALECDFRENRDIVMEIVKAYKTVPALDVMSDIFMLMKNE